MATSASSSRRDLTIARRSDECTCGEGCSVALRRFGPGRGGKGDSGCKEIKRGEGGRDTDGPGGGGHSHSGDLGNIEADQEGVAQVNITMKGTPLHFVLGRAFVVHAGKDDLKSQPSGAAGARIATGVIGIGNPEFTYKKAE